MTNIQDLKAIAERCRGHQPLRFMQSYGALYIRNDNGIVFDVHQNRSFPDFMAQNRDYADLVLAASPAAVLELIAEIERQSAQFKEWQASHHANYCAVADERDQLKAENETLRATCDLKAMLPELDDALEDLELHGQHSDQGYRKLKDWYRKVAFAYQVIECPMFGAEHGELVSQNTWLRSVIERYAQQEAPLEPIPDSDGWSTRLPGYDLPALLKDAERYRWLRSETGSGPNIQVSEWVGPHEYRLFTEELDAAIDNALSEESSHD